MKLQATMRKWPGLVTILGGTLAHRHVAQDSHSRPNLLIIVIVLSELYKLHVRHTLRIICWWPVAHALQRVVDRMMSTSLLPSLLKSSG